MFWGDVLRIPRFCRLLKIVHSKFERVLELECMDAGTLHVCF